MSSETTIVGPYWQPLPLRRQVNLKMERRDTNVQLPLLEIIALVVDSLRMGGTEILIGADAIAQSGGVRLRYENRTRLDGVFLGRAVTSPTANAASDPDTHPSRHSKMTRDGDDVILSTQNGEVRWDESAKKWVLSWRCRNGEPPKNRLDQALANMPGIGSLQPRRRSSVRKSADGLTTYGSSSSNAWRCCHSASAPCEST